MENPEVSGSNDHHPSIEISTHMEMRQRREQYEMALERMHASPTFLGRLMRKMVVKVAENRFESARENYQQLSQRTN